MIGQEFVGYRKFFTAGKNGDLPKLDSEDKIV